MSREIRFRVWDEDYKKMVYPIGIDWETKKPNIIYRYWTNDKKNIGSKIGMPVHKELSVLMQYTGLKDKNGKEIYEGDVVNGAIFGSSYSLGQVLMWCGEWLVYPLARIEGMASVYDQKHFLEVVGNIHENPELLNKQK